MYSASRINTLKSYFKTSSFTISDRTRVNSFVPCVDSPSPIIECSSPISLQNERISGDIESTSIAHDELTHPNSDNRTSKIVSIVDILILFHFTAVVFHR